MNRNDYCKIKCFGNHHFNGSTPNLLAFKTASDLQGRQHLECTKPQILSADAVYSQESSSVQIRNLDIEKESNPVRVNRFVSECAQELARRFRDKYGVPLNLLAMPGIKKQFFALVSAMAKTSGRYDIDRLKFSTLETYWTRFWPKYLPGKPKWTAGKKPERVYGELFPELLEMMEEFIKQN